MASWYALVRDEKEKDGNPVYIRQIKDDSIAKSILDVGGVISGCAGILTELEHKYNTNSEGFIVPPEENGKFMFTMNGYKVFVPYD